VTEIFLAYDSSDRERVRPVRDALAARGFDVHWDLEPPAGVEWETWVLRRLARCKCVVVLRSAASAHSNRISHVEAAAKEHGKLIAVRLEPRGLGAIQAGAATDGLNLAGWSGDPEHPGWQELCRRIETKLKASLWVQRLMHDVEMERARWRAQYDMSAARCKALNDELAGERIERGAAQDKAAGLQAQLDADNKSRFRLEARIVELEERLARAEATHAEAARQLREEIRQKDALLAEARTALGGAQDEADHLRTELAEVEGVHGELRARIAGGESLIGERDARIADLDAGIVRREADIAGLNAAVSARDAAIAGLKSTIAERESDIADLKVTVAERDDSVAILKSGITERDGAMTGLRAGVAARDADIAGLKTDVAERDGYIAELVASVTQRDTHIEDLRATIADRSAYMADLEASIAQRDTHIADLKSTLAERDTHIAGLQASLTELEQRPRGLVPLPAALTRVTRRRWGNAGATP
jgi:chromosome segregation ATPase